MFSCCLAVLFGATPLQADHLEATTLEVRDGQGFQSLTRYFEIYRAQDQTLSIDDVIAIHEAGEFSKVHVEQLNLAYTDEVIWLRFQLRNSDAVPLKLFLESGFSRLDYVSLFTPKDDGSWQEMQGGDRVPWYDWPMARRLVTFPLRLAAEEQKVWILKVHSTSTMHLPMMIVGDQTLMEAAEARYLEDGMFYGICLTVTMIALAVTLLLREDIYLFYFAHIVAGTLAVMTLDGVGFMLWSSALDFQEYSVVYMQCLFGAFLVLFARRYLRLKEHLPRIDRANRFFVSYMLCLIPVAPWLPFVVSSFLAVIPISLMVVGIFTQALIRALQGDRPAMIFTVAWTLCFMICVFVISANFGVVHNYVDSIYGLKLAFLTEYTVLLIGLGYRLYLLRNSEASSRLQALTERTENQAKGEILARISHEIRTPLNGILGITDLLQRTSLNEQQKKYTATVLDSGQSLLTIINDVLDHSRFDAGHISLEHIPFSLPELLDRIVDMFQIEADERGLHLDFMMDSGLPDGVIGDPTRLRQIIVNLLGNACKFTEEGRVSLKIRREWVDDEQLRLRVEVEDTGIGVEPELRGTVFNSFTRGASDIARRYGGSGLGLAISRQLVELMGGTIDFVSEPGRGSRFWFLVTLEVGGTELYSDNAPEYSIGAFKFPGNRVLVAEDNDTNWLVTSTYLHDLGVDAVRARDGEEAIKLYQSQAFDLILMDCTMPRLSGFEVVVEIRAIEFREDRPLTPVIGATTHISDIVREKCLLAGMDDYLGKPFTREEIAVMLSRYLTPELLADSFIPAEEIETLEE